MGKTEKGGMAAVETVCFDGLDLAITVLGIIGGGYFVWRFRQKAERAKVNNFKIYRHGHFERYSRYK